MELIFQEEDFLVKTITTAEEMDQALRLRHEVFCNELKWVPKTEDGLDRDRYDGFARSIGVFDRDSRIVGHVRLILAPDPFMIEHEFSSLLSDEVGFRKRAGMAEATRICIRKETRTDRYYSMTLANLIYKAMYHWSKAHDSDTLITIVERRYYVLLKRSKFPFVPLGEFRPLGEGVMSGIISLDWKRFDEVVSKARPEFYEWFVRIPDFAPLQLQSHGLY